MQEKVKHRTHVALSRDGKSSKLGQNSLKMTVRRRSLRTYMKSRRASDEACSEQDTAILDEGERVKLCLIAGRNSSLEHLPTATSPRVTP